MPYTTAEILGMLNLFAKTELGRILVTLTTIVLTVLVVKFLQKRARMQGATDIARQRRNLVLAKNLVLLTAVILIGATWASKIAGAALSLAAVAGAILIVSKEFLLNLLGTAMLAISRPYRIGDFVEVESISGRVLDTDLIATTLAETMEGNQLTGHTVSIPHSILLVKPVRNLTATGRFTINMLPVAVHPNEDMHAQEQALLQAAIDICGSWIEEANRHFERLESRELVTLPSAEPRVLIELKTVKEYTFSLRYCCRPNERVKVEQAIIRQYLATRNAAPAPAADEE
ncbi:mechanosensitive ion channel protein MscS [Oxalicibacterium flavum]|uniref:Mechanosensitive ion channel protein MscS n=1 Tax=Oxalicibacterium flavum TaxID=179467 RepID=A0A8J2ULQ9_9BURK|nr:mechanosensitive ion channel family protein [Oxalicibacterium flavum]GGC14335.1 mechanosensitive ion channel protein MscS [Oxalicibacterium flavum]